LVKKWFYCFFFFNQTLATLIFEGAESAFQLAADNKWDTSDIRLFALELAFKHGDADGARVALQELPRSLRGRAHELSAASGPMKWELLHEWSSACARWAVEDGDEEAAVAVKRARLLSSAAMSAVAPQQQQPQTRRGLKFEETTSSSTSSSSTTTNNNVSWKPRRALRKRWDGQTDDEVVRMACLEGSLSQALAYLRWRGANQVACFFFCSCCLEVNFFKKKKKTVSDNFDCGVFKRSCLSHSL
jgi:hypothetical protein